MTTSGQRDYTLNLDEGIKIANNLVRSGFSSKTDAFLQQLCQLDAANDDAVELFEKQRILKKIIDTVVVARKPLADDDKSRLFTYVEDALEKQMNPLAIGINDQTLAALIIENAENPSATQHNMEILQLAHQLEEKSAFFELTAAKYVQFDDTQVSALAGRCLDLAQTQNMPKGVLFALSLVNLEQLNMAMDILSALAQKGCATDMASFIHRLLPYVEGDEVSDLLELLQQNILQQNEIFEQPALYDYSARVYLQAVRSFAENEYYEQGEALIGFLQDHQRLNGFDDEVEQVAQFVEDVKQKHLESERQAALLQAQVEAMKLALEEQQAKEQQAEQAEENVVLEAEVVPVESVVPETSEAEGLETLDSMLANDEMAPSGEMISSEVIEEQSIGEEPMAMTEEMTSETEPLVKEDAETFNSMIASEEIVPTEKTISSEVTDEPMVMTEEMAITEENVPIEDIEHANYEDGGELSFEEQMAAADNAVMQEYAATEAMENSGVSFEEQMATAEDETMQEYTTTEAMENSGVSFEEQMAAAEDAAMQEYVQNAENSGKSLRNSLKKILKKDKLDNVGETVSNIKDKIINNNMINLNSDNLDKGIDLLKDVTVSAMKIAEEQTSKVRQKVEDIVKSDEQDANVSEANISEVPEADTSDVLSEETATSAFYEETDWSAYAAQEEPVANTPSNSAVASANSKKVVSSFYEVPFWERENAEELELREQALMQSAQNVEQEQIISGEEPYTEPASEVYNNGGEETTVEPTSEDYNNGEEETIVGPASEVYNNGEEEATSENTESSAENLDTVQAENVLNHSRIEERINERQEEIAEKQTLEEAFAEQLKTKPNFDDIDLDSVSNYSSLDDFAYQSDEDSATDSDKQE